MKDKLIGAALVVFGLWLVYVSASWVTDCHTTVSVGSVTVAGCQ
jgi:hypothetical protein